MRKSVLGIAGVAVILLLLVFVVQPQLRQRDAQKTVETILTHWQNNDLLPAMTFWQNEEDSPPVYDLLSYEILNKEFGKEEGQYYANITVQLIFPTGNPFFTDKNWVFSLKKTRHGWRVFDFRRQ